MCLSTSPPLSFVSRAATAMYDYRHPVAVKAQQNMLEAAIAITEPKAQPYKNTRLSCSASDYDMMGRFIDIFLPCLSPPLLN